MPVSKAYCQPEIGKKETLLYTRKKNSELSVVKTICGSPRRSFKKASDLIRQKARSLRFVHVLVTIQLVKADGIEGFQFGHQKK